MNNLILTENEKRMILNNREIEAHRLEKMEERAHVLEVAGRYARWLQEIDGGSTYSTFCDDFGYEAGSGEDRGILFRRVSWLLKKWDGE